MKFLKTTLKILLILAVLLVVVGLFLPSSVHVERTATINAPQATVFVLVNGFRNFNRWSPWFEQDPSANFSYSGPDFGVGSKLSWSSQDRELGSGTQEIIASEPYKLVRTHLDFGDKGTAEASLELKPSEGSTRVTWALDTEFGMDLIARYFGLMFDRMVGTQYETGLGKLKTLAEELPRADWSKANIRIVEVEPQLMAYTDGTTSWDSAEIALALGTAYSKVRAFMAENKLQQAGPPLAITRLATDDEWHFEAGVPLDAAPADAGEEPRQVFMRETYSGRVVRAIHVGSYQGVSETMEKIESYIAAFDLEKDGNRWEEFVSDPGETPENRLITTICVPIR